MEIRVRVEGDVVVASLEGRLAAGAGDVQLRDLIDRLLAENRRKILLDLSAVSSVDSSGVGELVAGRKAARELGADIKILQAPDRVMTVLSLAQLLPLFEVFETEKEALERFGRGACE